MMRYLIKLTAGLAAAAFCVSPVVKASPGKEGIIMVETAGSQAKLLMEALGIEEDCAQGIVDQLGEIGASEISKVDPIQADRGYKALVTDAGGRVYYIFLGGLGYLETIRRDSPEGEILYAAID